MSMTGTVEPDRQTCRLRRDDGAVSFSDPPVDAGIGITVAVLHRDKIEFDTVDITADRIEERIKTAIGFEKLCCAAVSIVGADRFKTVVKAPRGQSKGVLILGAEPQVEALSVPGGESPVDREPGVGGNPGPWITIGRMQPAAPEIERERRISHRIGPAANPASSFKDGERDLRLCKPGGGAKSGGARTGDDDLEIVCAARKHEG